MSELENYNSKLKVHLLHLLTGAAKHDADLQNTTTPLHHCNTTVTPL
jgi:hypothetical protein